jgi:heme A synthase
MECPLDATADAADRLRSLDAVLCLTEDPELRRLGLPRDGDARTYIKPMLRRPAAWSAIRLNSQEPVGAMSAGTCAGHAENKVEHAPDQHAETRPGDDVQWEVRAEVQAR